MIPWIIFAVVVVPLAVVVYAATRRRTAAGEHPASEDAKAKALTEQEFAEAEAYEAKWHEEDKKRYHEERLPSPGRLGQRATDQPEAPGTIGGNLSGSSRFELSTGLFWPK